MSVSPNSPKISPVVTALWLALAPAVTIGFGRFGYSLVLPAMKEAMLWSDTQAGALNSANAAGYLLGAVLTAPLTKNIPPRTAMLVGFAVSVAVLLGTGLAHNFLALLICRALIGTSAAFTFISATSLAARLGQTPRENALAMGLALSGPGVGVILTGVMVPFVVAGDNSHWPRAWWMMAVIGLVSFIGISLNTRELGSPGKLNHDVTPGEKARFGVLRIALVSYFLFGLGYIAYMTFLVAYVRSLGASPLNVALAWMVLGGSMIASTFVWKRSFETESGGRTLALMGIGGSISAALPLLSNQLPMLLVSTTLFGISAMPIFTAVTVLIRKHLPPTAWTNGIALATVIFAVGQSLGPIGAGIASDKFGSSASLWWTCSIMLTSAVIALFQKGIKNSPELSPAKK